MKTKTEATHTPLPWTMGANNDIGITNSGFVGGGQTICYMGNALGLEVTEANRAFIVRACNEYEKNQKTIEALMQFKNSMSFALRCFNEKYKPEDIFEAMRGHLEMVDKAIAQASEGK